MLPGTRCGCIVVLAHLQTHLVSLQGSLPLDVPAFGDLRQHICHAEKNMDS